MHHGHTLLLNAFHVVDIKLHTMQDQKLKRIRILKKGNSDHTKANERFCWDFSGLLLLLSLLLLLETIIHIYSVLTICQTQCQELWMHYNIGLLNTPVTNTIIVASASMRVWENSGCWKTSIQTRRGKSGKLIFKGRFFKDFFIWRGLREAEIISRGLHLELRALSRRRGWIPPPERERDLSWNQSWPIAELAEPVRCPKDRFFWVHR